MLGSLVKGGLRVKKMRIYLCLLLMSVSLTACMKETNTNKTPLILQTLPTLRSVESNLDPYFKEQIKESVELEKPGIVVLEESANQDRGVSWLIGKTSEGSPKYSEKVYELTYDQKGALLSKIYVPNSEKIVEAKPITYQPGAPVQVGSYFNSSRVTFYGADCIGCGGEDDGVGGTSAGISVSVNGVRQSNGEWQDGITYDGYYLIASDGSLPLCTVVEVTNHRFNGAGLSSGVPFKALVVDRGGAIKGTKIDLFAGSEYNYALSSGKKSGVKFTIVDFGKWTKNDQGQRMCRV